MAIPRTKLPKGPRKFPKAQKVRVDGYLLDSKAEARRYGRLRLLLMAGEISELEVHPVYQLVVNGMKIGRYTADFRYKDKQGNTVVEDVKGGRDSDPHMRYIRMRIKLVKALYGEDITLVHP